MPRARYDRAHKADAPRQLLHDLRHTALRIEPGSMLLISTWELLKGENLYGAIVSGILRDACLWRDVYFRVFVNQDPEDRGGN